MDDGNGFFILVLVFGFITGLLAYRKGYNGVIWFFTPWGLGLIVLAFLPFANQFDLPEEEKLVLKKQGNIIGIWLVGLAVVMIVLLAWTSWYLRS